MLWAAETRLALCYGSFSLFQSLLHNVFLLYHVDTFLTIHGISRTAFWVSELLFLLWNSCNDQLFGWLSDRRYLHGDTIDQKGVVLRRVRAIRTAGPLMALTFIMFWYKWAPPGLQFVLCLCLYDSALTVVDLQQSALLADLAVSSKARLRLGSYAAVFSGLGSTSVFLSYLFWDRTDPIPFRMFCLILAIVSALGFAVSSEIIGRQFRWSTDTKDRYSGDPGQTEQKSPPSSIVGYARQVAKHNNFLWFAALNLVQVFNCHFNSNFFPLFMETLLRGQLSPGMSSVLLGVSFLAPHLNNVYFMQLCQRWGTYTVLCRLFQFKVLLGLLLWFGGYSQIHLLCFFIASNRIFTEGVCKLLNQVVSDLVDEDMVLHGRPQAVAAIIFGTAALLSKPGQTLAPVTGTWLLGWYTGVDQFRVSDKTQWLSAEGGVKADMSQGNNSVEACFWLLVWVPLICASLQCLLWTRFTLHGSRLLWIKKLRADRQPTSHQQSI